MKAIIFDLDGTLLDSAPDIHASLNAALASHAKDVSLTQTRDFIGRGVPTLVARACKAVGLEPSTEPEVLDRFMTEYETAVALSRLYPGVADALDALIDAGHPLAICTNKPISPARFVARHFDLAQRMGAIIGGDSLPQRKPDPAPLRAALDGIGATDCIYVGDSETDWETAQNAGMPFVLFTEGYRHSPPDALPHAARFDDWTRFPNLIADLLNG